MRGEEIGLHDIFRTIPNPTMGLDEDRTAAITGSVQAMGLSLSNNEKIMKVTVVEKLLLFLLVVTRFVTSAME